MVTVAHDDALRPLGYIEGYPRGIRTMAEEDTPYVRVLKQAYPAQRAIEAFEQVVLDNYLRHRVPSGIHEGRDEEVVEEPSSASASRDVRSSGSW